MYTVSRKNGFTLKAETQLGARKALEQLFRCNAEVVFVETPGGDEYVVAWRGGKERWYKRTNPILHQAPRLKDVDMAEYRHIEDPSTEACEDYGCMCDNDDYNLQYACGGSEESESKKTKQKCCDRCGGSGIFYVRVHNGVGVPATPDKGMCYKCYGSGKVNS